MASYINRFVNHKYRLSTALFRVKPSFIIAGFQKCGTSAIYWNLMHHKHILAPIVKESNLLADPNFSSSPYKKLSYRSFFPLKISKLLQQSIIKGEAFSFETSPDLIISKGGINNAALFLGEVKWILFLREPISRALSGFVHARKRDNSTESFDEYINRLFLNSQRRDKRALIKDNEMHIYRSTYYIHVKKLLNRIERDKCLIISMENYKSNYIKSYSDICEFIEIPFDNEQDLMPFIESDLPEISESTIAILNDFFQPLNERLFKLINKRFDWSFRGKKPGTIKRQTVRVPDIEKTDPWRGSWRDLSKLGYVPKNKQMLSRRSK